MNVGRSSTALKRDLIGTDHSRLDIEQSHLLLEQENDQRLAELHSKMSSLKNIAIDIDGEVINQNRYLDEMSNDMGRTTNGLTVTMNRVGKMLSNADQPTLIVIVLVIVLLFIIVWKLLSNKNLIVCYLLCLR